MNTRQMRDLNDANENINSEDQKVLLLFLEIYFFIKKTSMTLALSLRKMDFRKKIFLLI